MPTIAAFHAKFWRARANSPPPPGTATSWMYPGVQSVVTLHTVFAWVPLAWIRPLWARLTTEVRWLWRLHQATAGERQMIAMSLACDVEQRAVVVRVLHVLQGETWPRAQAEVRTCATSPKFHQPEHWVSYSRIVKSNPGQAQNVWRHMRVVQAIQATDPTLTNPEAHLAAELAYQGLAAQGRPERRLIPHQAIA